MNTIRFWQCSPVATPIGLATAYHQATKAMQIGRRIHGPGSITSFDSLGVFRLLSLIDDAEELRSFAFDSLGPLLRLDSAERDDLLRTLEALVECNLNVARAARRLYFHYNTLRYRITKLERLLGPFTTDPNRCLQIGLALQILRIREVLQGMPHQLGDLAPTAPPTKDSQDGPGRLGMPGRVEHHR